MPSLYEILTREARPLPGESKPVFLLRRDLKALAVRSFKARFPRLWGKLDQAEHRRNIRRVGDRIKAEPIHLPGTIWRHFARHKCASGTGTMLRCDVLPDDPSRKTASGFIPPSEHPGLCSGVCPYCKERHEWFTDAPGD